jgi:ABC-type amino acid transport system permease subunit
MKKFRVVIIAKILISVCLIGAGILVFSGSAPGSFFFLDYAGLISVVLGAVAVTLMGFSFPGIGAAFRHALGSPGEPGKGELEKSIYFWEAAARNFFQVGVLMTVIGFIIMMKNIPAGIANVWKTLAIIFVTTLYGLILAALSAIAGLRVVKKLAGPGQPQQEMHVLPAIQGKKRNMEKIVGALLFIATLGWVVMKAEALMIFIHWPSLLIVAGGAILFVLWAGNGEDGLSTTLSFAFAGVIGILFGLAQMFPGFGASIARIAEGMTIAILSCVFGLVGMLLGGVHRQDHAFKTGKTDKKITISRIAWYGFPLVTLMLIFYAFVLMLIPVVKK